MGGKANAAGSSSGGSIVSAGGKANATGGSAGALAGGGAAGSSVAGAGASGSGTAGHGGASVDCSGAAMEGICWYAGARGQSCTEVCALHGGVAPGAAALVGTAAQGGSAARCDEILEALGLPDAPIVARQTDGLGLGCHLYAGTSYWLSSPAYDPDASADEALVVCGCSH
jgi:hypothetical protein